MISALVTHSSTADAAWWPERFYLATVQAREAMYEVKSDCDRSTNPLNLKFFLGPSRLRQQTRPHGKPSGIYREDGVL